MCPQFKYFIVLVASIAPLIANAQEAPRLGLLYNLSEVHSLTYSCTPASPGKLNCDFVQTSVRPKATFADLPVAIERARKEFSKGPLFSKDECKLNQSLVNVISGKEKAPKQEAVTKLTVVQRKDALALAQAGLAVCNQPTEAAQIEFVRIAQDRDRRTCKVSALHFSQTFRAASADSSGTNAWVADGKPEGPCGIVQLSRFEPEQTKIGGSLLSNWRFIAKKAITNPSAEFLPGASCSRLDEQPYTYDWRIQEHQVTCDYIVFSPI